MNTETTTKLQTIAAKLNAMYEEVSKLYDDMMKIRDAALINDPWSDETETIEQLTDNVADLIDPTAYAVTEIERAIDR